MYLNFEVPGAEWLCLAEENHATARTRKREKWSFGPAEERSFVVPSPMTNSCGKELSGKTSHRCLDNTGPRRWLVIEFDKLEDGVTDMPIDEQAALAGHFRAAAIAAGWPPLRLCVHSAGKSLHSWFGPVESEDTAFELMAYAIMLGADSASWNRCQLMRLPEGKRTVAAIEPWLPDGWDAPTSQVRQRVMYFNPGHA